MVIPQKQVPLAPLTTFTIGGSAGYFIEVATEEEIMEALQWARARSVRHMILAGGSNVLVADAGFDGVVIKIASTQYRFEETVFIADAGCVLWDCIRRTAQHDLGGWEQLAGIPGTIGGAVRGNAGAFGTEIRDVLMWVDALNTDTFEVRTFKNEECAFRYRHSFFKHHPEWVITRAAFQLTPVRQEEGERIMGKTVAEREQRHIQNVRAAGSFFVNPEAPRTVCTQFEEEKGVASKEGRVPAGWLIEKAGCKGMRVGGATASQMHPNYIVNEKNATAADVLSLANTIQKEVHEAFGVRLTEEVTIIGA